MVDRLPSNHCDLMGRITGFTGHFDRFSHGLLTHPVHWLDICQQITSHVDPSPCGNSHRDKTRNTSTIINYFKNNPFRETHIKSTMILSFFHRFSIDFPWIFHRFSQNSVAVPAFSELPDQGRPLTFGLGRLRLEVRQGRQHVGLETYVTQREGGATRESSWFNTYTYIYIDHLVMTNIAMENPL